MQLQFNPDADRYEAITEYRERLAVKAAGFRWDPETRCWHTRDLSRAVQLIEIADMEPEFKARLEAASAAAEAARRQARADSRATTSDAQIPCPDGLAFLPYQKAGIAYALQRQSTLIGDEMGLGKTIQAIGLINASPEVKRVLVICPASLRLNWQRELQKWLTRHFTIDIATGRAFPSYADIVIINYDILTKHPDDLRGIDWDLLIADECHFLKSSGAQRTKAVLGGKVKGDRISPIPARRRLFLTGTPILNRPIELHTILRSIDPAEWGDWYKYTERYCGLRHTAYGLDASGSSNLDELQQRLRETCMVRRLKADVLDDLPAKRRQVIELPANGCSAAIRAEQKTQAEAEERVMALEIAVEMAKASEDPEDYKEAVKALRSGRSAAFGQITKVIKETSLAKVPYVIDHLRNASGKVVIFAHHHVVIDALMEALGDEAVKLTGGDAYADRDGAVSRFQNDDSIRFFIGGITVAGMGLTLTAASHVLFAELNWVPGMLSQAEDRCHRIGQDESVLVQHLVLEGSIDAVMAKRVVEKQEVIDAALDTVHAERDDDSPDLAALIEPPATKSISREQVIEAAAILDAADIHRIHRDLRRLADSCDGAQEQDGTGFNRLDTRIGKDLAAMESLTPRQAALGAAITRKYRRQLGYVD